MNYQEKTVTLKDGTVCRICSPQKKDAGQILEHMRITSEETHHMLRYPDEIMRTREEEEQYLEESLNSETDLLIAAFIGEELVAFTRSSFPLSDKREETFIGGLSMGGFGAIVNGLRNPDTFGYITAFSSALIKRLILRSDEEEGLDYFTRAQYQSMFGLAAIDDFEGSDCDYEALAEKLAASGKEKPKIYMDCGTEDVSLYQANADFKDRLLSLGYEVTWDSRSGGHDGKFWSESFCKAAAYLPVEKLELAPDSPSAARLTRMNAAMTRKMTE